MIEIEEIANGYYRFIPVWKGNQRIKLTLTLTDPDGDIDTREFIWKPDQDTPVRIALAKLAVAVDELPHWRAWFGDGELSVGTTNPNNTYTVTAEML